MYWTLLPQETQGHAENAGSEEEILNPYSLYLSHLSGLSINTRENILVDIFRSTSSSRNHSSKKKIRKNLIIDT